MARQAALGHPDSTFFNSTYFTRRIPRAPQRRRFAGFWRIHSATPLPFLEQLSEYSCDHVFRPVPPVSFVPLFVDAKYGSSR
jgi:hypothetical protein